MGNGPTHFLLTACVAALLPSIGEAATDAEIEALRAEIAALKTEHEARVGALEARISQLETTMPRWRLRQPSPLRRPPLARKARRHSTPPFR